MQIWQSRSQHYKDGKRISKALFDEIMAHATKRGDIHINELRATRGVYRHWVYGMTGNVYRFEWRAGKIDWAEELLKAGE
jgi:hypothetical protein